MKIETLFKLASLFEKDESENENICKNEIETSIPNYISEGKPVIVRTYSAGNWFGVITERIGAKIKIINARRMYRWQCNSSISLSGCALYGIDYTRSKIVEPVEYVWVEDIEIISCTPIAITNLMNAPFVKQE